MMQEPRARIERRLSAILAADVVGYSRLMGLDEVGTANILRGHRAVSDGLVAKHGGRIVNTTGDAVFDGTLKQALAIQLQQSPFLYITPEERIRKALQFMGRSPDERLTNQLAREICQREGIKALISGSVSGLGSQYVIALDAINAQTGDTLAREQVQADRRENVLVALGRAARRWVPALLV